MDFELRRAREKLEKEQRERKERARRKLESEREAKQEAILRRQAIEEVQRGRRMIAAEAEAKANQLEEESLVAGRGVKFSRILEAVPYQGIGDKIKLPPSCFRELSEKGAFDKGPLHFSLSLIHQESPSGSQTSENGMIRTTHAGVLEFTTEEGFVSLPQHCWNNLFFPSAGGASSSGLVEVRYVWLPKGSYAKLQSVEMGFSDIPNHKAVLETSLRQHATLSQGDTLTVAHGVLTYHLRILELKPSSSISVLETDIEVDIIGPESASDERDQYVLKPLVVGKPEQGFVEEGNYAYYKFTVAEDASKLTINLESQTREGDVDLYVSRHPLLFPTQHRHVWSSHDVGSKSLVLTSEDRNFGPGTYSIAVFGFKGTSKYQLSIKKVEEEDGSSSHRKPGHHHALSSDGVVDSVVCGNCRRPIPSRTIGLHEAYCRRHNVVCGHEGCGIVVRVEEAGDHLHCEKCGAGLHRGEVEKHSKVFHEPLRCPCGILLEKEHMV
ncbi:hypothetical protein M569_03586, partial [Genlisea aurea]